MNDLSYDSYDIVRFPAAVAKAIEELKSILLTGSAEAIGAEFDGRFFRLNYFSLEAALEFPSGDTLLDGRPTRGVDKILLLHYLLQALRHRSFRQMDLISGDTRFLGLSRRFSRPWSRRYCQDIRG